MSSVEYERSTITSLRRERDAAREQRDSAVRVAHRAYRRAHRLDQAERLLALTVTPDLSEAEHDVTETLIREFLGGSA